MEKASTVWGRCASTMAAVAADQERIAKLLEADLDSDPADVTKAKAIAVKARLLVERFTNAYLAEV
jgi:hypothetical protein